MTLKPDFLYLVLALAVASYACRAGGFWVMRFVKITPRVEAALRAAPLAVMVGVVTPAAVHGGIAELVGLAAAIGYMRWRGGDVTAAMIGVFVVAVLRAAF